MEIADGAERIRGSFHRVAPDCSMQMKIDKAWREIISGKIDNLVTGRACLWADLRDFAVPDDQLERVTSAIGKNATPVTQDHAGRRLRFRTRKSSFERGLMAFDYDVVIIGGAFSGAATALMLMRRQSDAHVF